VIAINIVEPLGKILLPMDIRKPRRLKSRLQEQCPPTRTEEWASVMWDEAKFYAALRASGLDDLGLIASYYTQH
jgi:hypothetical protein